MSADKTADAIKLNLRLPKGLHKRLQQQAKRNNVSLNTEIINQLEGHDAATVERVVEIVLPLLRDLDAARRPQPANHYYPLLSAISALEKNTAENRRAIYERERAALLATLRGMTPALDEADVTRERLALEEAIRKVEEEAARRFAMTPADEKK